MAHSEVENERLHIDVDRGVEAIVLLVPRLDVADLAKIGVVFGAQRNALEHLSVEFHAGDERRLPALQSVGQVPIQNWVEGEEPILTLVADDGRSSVVHGDLENL